MSRQAILMPNRRTKSWLFLRDLIENLKRRWLWSHMIRAQRTTPRSPDIWIRGFCSQKELPREITSWIDDVSPGRICGQCDVSIKFEQSGRGERPDHYSKLSRKSSRKRSQGPRNAEAPE